jgi:hypothetical protein
VSPTETPSVASSLIAALEQGGELVDAGEFSVDAGQALVKLRDYQLVDPHGWVLLVIEAAVLAGATPVSVPAEGELVVELSPLELRADELEQLFAWVFIELEGIEGDEWRRRRALQQLALASNAVLGLELDELVIESIDLQGRGSRLRMTRAQPLGVLESIADAAPGTRVRVVGLAGERERQLVRERCRYTTHDIRIGDERISRGAVGALVDDEFVQMREQVGWAGGRRTKPLIDAQGQTIGAHGKAYRVASQPSLLIIANGVLIERVELDAAPNTELMSNFVAVVEIDLPRDLSQAKVRRGPEFESIVQAARSAATKLDRRPQGKLREFELVSNEGVGPRVLYSLMAVIGCMGGFLAFTAMLAGKRGTLSWFLILSMAGVAGIALLVKTKPKE